MKKLVAFLMSTALLLTCLAGCGALTVREWERLAIRRRKARQR